MPEDVLHIIPILHQAAVPQRDGYILNSGQHVSSPLLTWMTRGPSR